MTTRKQRDAAGDQVPWADPTSSEVVLWFLEGTRSARNAAAPARDLTRADIARLAYVESARLGGADGIRPDPRQPDQALATAIAERLLASGRYTDTAPADPAPDDDTAPAAADAEEG